MKNLVSTRQPYGVDTYCISYNKLDQVISSDQNIYPSSTSQWLRFDSQGLIDYLCEITGIDWSNCNFYDDEVTVIK